MFYTYMLASRRNGTLYVGSTDGLQRRMWEHRAKVRPGFTARYGVTLLVWFERHETRAGAVQRERRIKAWRRSWKIMLIEADNPTWRDLCGEEFPEPDVAAWLAGLPHDRRA
ncbi:MAG: GIY-YIG nuclease family protein [Phenylobacterium sp.]|uniref:GIY-YIG nuclease family protein n=1 Tax=Phenylobacterium sp. TaxID=1871053 RepID=UPI001A59D530|nr:GIY-YIG nuclease family protein [Phenylobacterium sp.]